MISPFLNRVLGLIRTPRLKPPINAIPCTSDFQWKSLNDDPQYVIKLSSWRSGWYILELSIQHDRVSAVSSIYLDEGNGFNEDKKLDLPLKQDKTSKRLIYISKKTKRIRLDPMSEVGRFTVNGFRFVRLSNRAALLRLYNKLSSLHPQFLGLNNEEIDKKIRDISLNSGLGLNETRIIKYEEIFRHAKPESNYNYLVYKEEFEAPDAQLVQSETEHMPYKPKISIILPVYNSSIEFLEECINSVLYQSYVNWQLCIVDDASSKEELLSYLRSIHNIDSRINIIYRKENGHISKASNSALALVSGDFTALLDHDDKLNKNAFYYLAKAINENPGVKFIYSDEDKIDESGKRFSPHFKPDWNPDLLLSHNYICHLSVFETGRLKEIGGFRVGFEGSQDHDLVLRYTQGLSPHEICHVPRVLYHWRAIEGSTALSSSAKSYTEVAGEKAVFDAVKHIKNFDSVCIGPVSNSYRVKWKIPDPAPLVSIIIPTRDGIDILKPCVDSILSKTTYTNYELLILDNQSQCKETLSYLTRLQESDKRVKILHWDYPFNYSAINNFGVKNANGSIVALLNNDVEPLNNDWLTEMVSHVMRDEIGCVGAMLYYPDDTIQHAGVVLGLGGVAGHSHKHFARGSNGYSFRLKLVQNFSAVTAACLLVRKSVYEEVGGLNEEHLTVAFNDVDFCLKVREAGYRNLWTPYAELIHHESVSRGGEDNPAKRARAKLEMEYMRKTWGKQLDSDPAYNPNLTKAYEDFSLRQPIG